MELYLLGYAVTLWLSAGLLTFAAFLGLACLALFSTGEGSRGFRAAAGSHWTYFARMIETAPTAAGALETLRLSSTLLLLSLLLWPRNLPAIIFHGRRVLAAEE